MKVNGPRRLPIGSSKENLVCPVTWEEDGRTRRRTFLIRREVAAGVLEAPIETEFKLMQALRGTGVPVPAMYWLESDPRWLDHPFLVEQFIPGHSSWNRLALSTAGDKATLIRHLVRILADQHRLDWGRLGIDFLDAPKGPDDCATDQISGWTGFLRRQRLEPQPLVELLLQWLSHHPPPAATRISLLHGDPGPGNFIFRRKKIVAVVDWEMAHLGDPMDDIAWLCFRLGATRLDVDRQDIFRTYTDLSGIPVDSDAVRYYEIFANVRAAIACLGGMHAFSLGENLDLNLAYIGITVRRWFLLRATRLIATTQ